MEKELPIIKTERLILRQIRNSDAEDFYEYAKQKMVGENAGWHYHQSIAESKAVIRLFNDKRNFGQLGVYSIILKEENKMIGTIELHTYVKGHKAELGYALNPKYWGNGYIVEASKYLIAYGFDVLKLKRIECYAFVANLRSKRVCEKLGLTYEGIRKKAYQLYDGSIHDELCYAIIDDEFYNRIREESWF
ncbi:MAG: GNAT family protein [Bacilli bacterium]|jgi:ribosomal-protein-alanine N-acetyltransferase|nr:GNAT family protein [Bacilli bacterium]MDD2681961.1 GNAT family protein [Bacilli bacterium]MDD3121282.1 GNAT family protein [Bacilli bacterium]MDD4063467.1 GNAT family protein [Bacilli bacterium]MDD4482128.1 GNAT family protein [Bacilli bacterium]